MALNGPDTKKRTKAKELELMCETFLSAQLYPFLIIEKNNVANI